MWLHQKMPLLILGTLGSGSTPMNISLERRQRHWVVATPEKLMGSGKLDSNQKQLAQAELARKCKIVSRGARKRGKLNEAEYYENIAAPHCEATTRARPKQSQSQGIASHCALFAGADAPALIVATLTCCLRLCARVLRRAPLREHSPGRT